MPDDLLHQAFLDAWSALPVGAGGLFHSDHGSQYASGNSGKTLAAPPPTAYAEQLAAEAARMKPGL